MDLEAMTKNDAQEALANTEKTIGKYERFLQMEHDEGIAALLKEAKEKQEMLEGVLQKFADTEAAGIEEREKLERIKQEAEQTAAEAGKKTGGVLTGNADPFVDGALPETGAAGKESEFKGSLTQGTVGELKDNLEKIENTLGEHSQDIEDLSGEILAQVNESLVAAGQTEISANERPIRISRGAVNKEGTGADVYVEMVMGDVGYTDVSVTLVKKADGEFKVNVSGRLVESNENLARRVNNFMANKSESAKQIFE